MANIQQDKAKIFYDLHHKPNQVLILPNVWDALSSKIFEQEGAKAIATTSAGIAVSLGFADGENVPLDLFFAITERIIKSVNIPVTVDIESGMGKTVEQICKNIERLIKIGAAGINIEDASSINKGQLISIEDQAAKVKAIKTYLNETGSSIFINARIDTYWLNNIKDELECFRETSKRIAAYQHAGADGIFIPGLIDLEVAKRLTMSTNLPLNLLGNIWIKSIDELSNYGIKRISTGSNPIRSIVPTIRNIGKEILKTGSAPHFNDAVSYTELNSWF